MTPRAMSFFACAGSSVGMSCAVLVLHAFDVTQQDELLGLQRAGDFPRRHVRIDVVSLPLAIKSRRSDHRNESGAIERAQDVDIHFDHIADQADVDLALAPGCR